MSATHNRRAMNNDERGRNIYSILRAAYGGPFLPQQTPDSRHEPPNHDTTSPIHDTNFQTSRHKPPNHNTNFQLTTQTPDLRHTTENHDGNSSFIFDSYISFS